jgi:DNA repair exonuclease SbcCD nuclease subunit
MPAQAAEDDVALKILHTADWHLGKDFPEFDPEDHQKLTRARLNAVEQVFVEAESAAVDAVLCAGDLFDEPNPKEEWWRPLLELLQKRTRPGRPIVLLPGNHDPLTEKSVYSPGHPFRQQLPSGIHLVDREDFTLELGAEKQAVVYAIPCRSKAGASDPTERFASRAAGDERIRIGMAHGQTIDIKGYQMNFPIRPENARARGLDYLALGDTHAFRNHGDDDVPVVYPGAPEQTRFGEEETGRAVLVYFRRAGARPLMKPKLIRRWQWRDEVCTSLSQLEKLAHEVGPDTVLRLKLTMSVTLAELDQVEKSLVELKGSPALVGKAGIVRIDRGGLTRRPASADEFPAELPEVLKATLTSLASHENQEVAQRAIYHLYRLVTRCG